MEYQRESLIYSLTTPQLRQKVEKAHQISKGRAFFFLVWSQLVGILSHTIRQDVQAQQYDVEHHGRAVTAAVQSTTTEQFAYPE